MPLTEQQVETATPKDKQYKLFDGKGLYLLVSPNGRKGWRFKYRFEGKEKLVSFGSYPKVMLADARKKRVEARKLVTAGINPAEQRIKAAQAGRQLTFEQFARQWYREFSRDHSASYVGRTGQLLERELLPRFGAVPIDSIELSDLVELLQDVARQGRLETARRTCTLCRSLFRFAYSAGLLKTDISVRLKGVLPRTEQQSCATLSEPTLVGELLRAIDGYQGSYVVRCALQLAPLLLVRPVELRYAEWTEIDLYKSLWTLPAKKLRLKQPRLVPLPQQASAILKNLYRQTGRGRYLFPSLRSSAEPLSDNALNAALRRLGYQKNELSAQGIRETGRLLLSDLSSSRHDLVAHQLGQLVLGPLGRPYESIAFLPERVRMMQKWADYLDLLRAETGTLRAVD